MLLVRLDVIIVKSVLQLCGVGARGQTSGTLSRLLPDLKRMKLSADYPRGHDAVEAQGLDLTGVQQGPCA